MYPNSNQPARIYSTVKTHKFNNTDKLNINDLKFRPIIDQTNTYTYHAVKLISDLKPLRSNEYTIKDTQLAVLKGKYIYVQYSE